MYTEDYKHNGFLIRKLLLKIILILAILIMLIWIVPKFITYKPSNKVKNNKDSIKITEKNIQKTDFSKNLQTLKEAALVYYKEEKLPKEKEASETVTLKQLIEDKLITNLYNGDKKCDNKKSYVKITKLEEDYLLKVVIVCQNQTDYILVHVGKYDFCTNAICEKGNTTPNKPQEDKKKEEKKEQEEINKEKEEEKLVINEKENKQEESKNPPVNINKPVVTPPSSNNNTNYEEKLTEFGPWSNYTRTSCNTAPITCDIKDKNCLKEIQIKKEQELIRTELKKYTTISLELMYKSTTMTLACKNYNYVNIQGTTYKTTGDYEQIAYLGNKTSTDSWRYIGTISTRETPNFGGDKYYKFIGGDFSSCGNTCPNGPSYYYEVYQYTKSLIRTNNLLEGCNGFANKRINHYAIAKQSQTVARSEFVYGEVCYESFRTRKVMK